MTTETNDEFMGAVSPHCIVHDTERRDAVKMVVVNHAHYQGLPEPIAWATLRAMNALNAGESAHRAIQAGQLAVDEWPQFFGNHAPVTSAWKAAQSMGLLGIHCTASGVAGYYHGPYVREVVPQPSFIESSGRWTWPLPEHARFPGCSDSVCTASREWWEYAPSEAKPHPMAEGVRLRDGIWYWIVPADGRFYVKVEAS